MAPYLVVPELLGAAKCLFGSGSSLVSELRFSAAATASATAFRRASPSVFSSAFVVTLSALELELGRGGRRQPEMIPHSAMMMGREGAPLTSTGMAPSVSK
mmetsp:Transcript_17524/g.30644  ORF Transcript_17524/g.30644 Transcript_17524/m.30644 type:complete len:101 (-) Transcript_17524:195-497(-)